MKHHQIQPNIILTMFHYKPTPRSLNFIVYHVSGVKKKKKKIFIFLIFLLVKHQQLQPNIILTMFHYKPTPRSLNFIQVLEIKIHI